MASNSRKEQIRLEKEKNRRKYRVLKELRLWLAGFLLASLVITAIVGVLNGKENGRLYGISSGHGYGDAVALSYGDSKISLMALSYLFYDSLYEIGESDSFMLNYGAYGLDLGKPLRELEYTALRSWYDELMEQTVSLAESTVRYSALAKKNGTKLSDEDKRYIDDKIKDLSERAEKEGRGLNDYLDYRYCPGLTEAYLRETLEVYRLAQKQYDLTLDELQTCSEEELSDYYYENRAELETLDFITYRFKMDDVAAQEALKASFESCKTRDEFLALIRTDLPRAGCPEGQIESALAESQNRLQYGTESAFADWAFESGRKEGDIFTREADGYTEVYYIVRPGGKYTFPSANVRALFVNYEAFGDAEKTRQAAEELYGKALENGTEEYFIQLVKEKSHDFMTASYGGEYSDIVPGDLAEDFNDWVFAEGRKAGDIGLVESEGSYNIFYYIGDGDPCWMVTARNALVDERVTDFEEKLAEEMEIDEDVDAIFNTLPDDLATDHERGYSVTESGSDVDYRVSRMVFVGFYCCIAVSVLLFAAAAWCFIETYRLKKRFGYV